MLLHVAWQRTPDFSPRPASQGNDCLVKQSGRREHTESGALEPHVGCNIQRTVRNCPILEQSARQLGMLGVLGFWV